VEGLASGPALSLPGGISRSPRSIRRFLSHTTRARRCEPQSGSKCANHAADLGRPTLPSVLRWLKGARVLTPFVAHPASRHRAAREGSGYRCGRVPRVCPRDITPMIRLHTIHRGSSATRADASCVLEVPRLQLVEVPGCAAISRSWCLRRNARDARSKRWAARMAQCRRRRQDQPGSTSAHQ
jgi:hypothetical protein